MELRDSRRVPGPGLLWERASAQIDVALEPAEVERFLSVFELQLRRVLETLGWSREKLCTRRFPGGVSLALSAPVDALYAACEVTEWAFAATYAVLKGGAEPSLAATAERIRGEIAEERAARSNMRALEVAAREHGVDCVTDDDHASVGTGAGSLTFEAAHIPDPASIDWDSVRNVPIALITGTNGKTTTVRFLASITGAAGLTAGSSSTDWIRIGDEVIDEGDWSGPSGARTVLRDRRVELALLETARGGMLRRGLGTRRADVALITNVGEDHLGEWGVEDLAALVETKFIVTRALSEGGRLVLNADDPEVAARGRRATAPVTWFTLEERNERVTAHVAAGGTAAMLAGDELVIACGPERSSVARVDEIPATLGGAARHNVMNALAAVGVAAALELPLAAIRTGLTSFQGDHKDNPGRLNVFELGGVRCVVDFAHNPHGLEAVFDVLARIPAERRGLVLGQAGDRDDESIGALARTAWSARPDRIVIKEMPEFLRGREPGEVPELLAAELRRAGAPPAAVVQAPSEHEAVRDLLRWSRAGDVLVLLSHAERAAAFELLEELQARGWTPGDEL
jgi:UDP-N-acetylmuramyl tripeptide synthase